MAYKKPVCECGTELIYSTEIVYLTQKKINKNGKFSKNKKLISVNELGVYTATGISVERLLCTECLKSYECEYDNKNRVIQGEEI